MTTTTVPDVPAIEPDAAATGRRIIEYGRHIPTIQWCKARLRYGFGYESAGSNVEGLFLVVANEVGRAETGRDQWARFEAMSVDDLVADIEAHLPAPDAAPDAPDATHAEFDPEDGDPKSVG